MTSAVPSAVARPHASIWPIVVAPFVAGIYYLAIKSAFAQTIVSALGKTAATDIRFEDIYSLHWGSHWVYRLAAEFISTYIAIFLAAGLAHGRERAAAIVGGCIISLGYVTRIGILLHAWKYLDPNDYSVREPWYQYVIECAMVIAPPVAGIYIAEVAQEMHRDQPVGVGGINRVHFLWLWFAVFWYALGLITPVARFYALGPDSGLIASLVTLIVNGVPVAAIAIPGYFGLAILAGHKCQRLHPAARNFLGSIVLVIGYAVGVAVQLGWYWVFQQLWDFIYG